MKLTSKMVEDTLMYHGLELNKHHNILYAEILKAIGLRCIAIDFVHNARMASQEMRKLRKEFDKLYYERYNPSTKS